MSKRWNHLKINFISYIIYILILKYSLRIKLCFFQLVIFNFVMGKKTTTLLSIQFKYNTIYYQFCLNESYTSVIKKSFIKIKKNGIGNAYCITQVVLYKRCSVFLMHIFILSVLKILNSQCQWGPFLPLLIFLSFEYASFPLFSSSILEYRFLLNHGYFLEIYHIYICLNFFAF